MREALAKRFKKMGGQVSRSGESCSVVFTDSAVALTTCAQVGHSLGIDRASAAYASRSDDEVALAEEMDDLNGITLISSVDEIAVLIS